MKLDKQPKELTVEITESTLTISDKWGYTIEVEQYENKEGEKRLHIEEGMYLGEGEKGLNESLLDIPSSDLPELIEYFKELVGSNKSGEELDV